MQEPDRDVPTAMPSTPTQKRKRPLAPKSPASPRRCKRSKPTFSRTGTFAFLSLPGELRNQVYKHLLIAQDWGRYARDELTGTMRVHQLSMHPSPFSASDLLADEVYFSRRLGISATILRTCKQIHDEAIDILYQNVFLIDLDYRRAVLSQSPALVAKLWRGADALGPAPISIPPAWDVSRITKLHLRIEMHRQCSKMPVHIYTFCYPELGQMTSLKTLEISVLYTVWSEKWRSRPHKLEDHARAMAFFRGERKNEEVLEQFQEFVKHIVGSIPKEVKIVMWIDGSEGWRPKNTRTVQPETRIKFLGTKSPSVRSMLPRNCGYVKREVLEMVADEVVAYRGLRVGAYRRRVKEVAAAEAKVRILSTD